MTKNPEVNTDKVISEYTIAAVPWEMIDLIWDRVAPLIQKVVEKAHGEITLDSVKARLKTGNSLLITISRGSDIVAVNTMELRIMDSGLRAMFIPITGGSELDGWMDQFLEVAKALAKDYNCTELRGLAVRKGWMRVLEKQGWEEVHTIIKCDLGEK